jgi:hypothetical protein
MNTIEGGSQGSVTVYEPHTFMCLVYESVTGPMYYYPSHLLTFPCG